LFSRDFAGLDAQDVTTENRGVPGSSPGLAISRKARLLDLVLSGASGRHPRKGDEEQMAGRNPGNPA
jgi:hypothetical protein